MKACKIKVYKVKVSSFVKGEILKTFFSEKELNTFVEEIYFEKMNRLAQSIGEKKYTPMFGLRRRPNNNGSSTPTHKYYAMRDCSDKAPCTLKIEISSTYEPLLG